MRLFCVLRGARHEIWAIDLTDERQEHGIPAWDFLNALEASAFKSMTNVLRLHVENGPIFNIQKSRSIGDGLFEFKTPQGARILYFYGGQPHLTVLTHGFMKKSDKTPRGETDRASALRAAYHSSAGRLP